MLVEAAESPPSTARCVSPLLVLKQTEFRMLNNGLDSTCFKARSSPFQPKLFLTVNAINLHTEKCLRVLRFLGDIVTYGDAVRGSSYCVVFLIAPRTIHMKKTAISIAKDSVHEFWSNVVEFGTNTN